MADPDLDDIERRMNGAREVLRSEFGGLRTGRASASLLDPIMVDAYGAQMPLNQVGTVSVPEPRMISVQVWDGSLVRAVEKAIRDAGLAHLLAISGLHFALVAGLLFGVLELMLPMMTTGMAAGMLAAMDASSGTVHVGAAAARGAVVGAVVLAATYVFNAYLQGRGSKWTS